MNQMNESIKELPIPMALLKRLPKTDLHVHLDGSLRPIDHRASSIDLHGRPLCVCVLTVQIRRPGPRSC